MSNFGQLIIPKDQTTGTSDQERAVAANNSKKKKTATSASADAVSAGNSVPASTKGTSVSGIPTGTKVRIGVDAKGQPVYSTPQYTTDSPYTVVAGLSDPDKATLLLQMGSVKGLYPTGQEPTPGFISSQGGTVSFRPADYTALTALMRHADTVGTTYDQSLKSFYNSPTLAEQYFGKVTATPKKIAITPAEALIAEMDAKYKDLFNTAVDKKSATSYAKEVNKAELAAGGAITAQQKEDIFLHYVQNTATSRFKAVTPGTEGTTTSPIEQGALGARVRQLRGAYADNGLPVSDKQVYNEAVTSLRDQQALDNKLQDIQLQAAAHFPAFKDLILKGKTVKDLVSPYMNIKSTLFNIPAEQLNVTDFYDVGGGPAPMSLKDYKMSLYKDPAYKNTEDYRVKALNDTQALIGALGLGPI